MGGTSVLGKFRKSATNHKIALQIILICHFDWKGCTFSFIFRSQENNVMFGILMWRDITTSIALFSPLHYFPPDYFHVSFVFHRMQMKKDNIYCASVVCSPDLIHDKTMNNSLECTKNPLFFSTNPHVSFQVCLHTDAVKCTCYEI